MLAAAKRSSWLGSRKGWFGVSAVDGSYHWVDLPQPVDPVIGPVLSPDGTKIGYTFTGPVSGRPFSHAVGFSIYDTVTGHVSTWRIPTRHGLAQDGYRAGTWTADSRWFVVYFGQTKSPNTGDDFRLLALPADGGPARAQKEASTG